MLCPGPKRFGLRDWQEGDCELQSQRGSKDDFKVDTDLGTHALSVSLYTDMCIARHRQGVPTAWPQLRRSSVILPNGEMFGNGYKLKFSAAVF